jgi:hypothetical protein
VKRISIRRTSRAPVVLGLALTAVLPRVAAAQIADLQRSAVADVARLTFGYLCDDTFLLRNDGDKSVDAKLGVAKSGTQSPVSLGAHEQVQFSSKSKDDVELWMGDKLVAKAEKDKRACKDVQGNASVAVAPLEVATDSDKGRRAYANYPYFDPWFYGGFGAPFGPWGGGFGGVGFRPFYTGFVGVPIVVNGRGGGRRR